MSKILITGGSGLLGQELLKLDSTLLAPLHSELDICEIGSVEHALDRYKPATVIHLAAATKPPEHEKNPRWGIQNNIIGTANIACACVARNIRLIYTGTDYVYAGPGPHRETEGVFPPYPFGWSKLGGDCSVLMIPNSLVLRLSFGPIPFPWEKVYAGQWNSKLYVDEAAPLVLALAGTAATGIINVGGPRTTLADYARRSRATIQEIPKPDWVPADTSLDISRMLSVLGIKEPGMILKR